MSLINNLEDDVQRFVDKYGKSMELIERLHATTLDFLNLPFSREGPANNIIYLLSSVCLREFNEILLLASHRYGIGALKILRPLFERVITLRYIAQHPTEAERFIDYSKVHCHKLLLEGRIAAGTDDVMEKDEMERIEREYTEVKTQFEQTVCKDCGGRRIVSWTKLSTPDMARELGGNIRRLYFNAFLWPTCNIHTTFYGIARQIALNIEESEDDAVHMSLNIAHGLLIQVIDVLNKYFDLGKTDDVNERAKEWNQAWLEYHPLPDSA